MLKTLGKILAILLVTAVVAGALYFLLRNTAAADPRFPAREGEFGSTPRGEGFRPPDQNREHRGEREGEHGASIDRGLVGVLGTTLQISVIAFVVIQIRRFLTRPRQPAATRQV